MATNPKILMDLHRLDPKKSLGQNFLYDPNTLQKIITSADMLASDTVLEIGPGTGALTAAMAEHQVLGRVVAVEIDQRLRPILASELEKYDNVHLIFEDFLKVHVDAVVGDDPYLVVANVPYYITSAIIKHLLEYTVNRPYRLVMTMQSEVAERICATPDSRDMSLLAVSVQFYGQPHIVTRLKPGAFWPQPDVSSAVLRVDVFPEPPVDVPDEKTFFRVVKAGFSQKRKQLKNAVGGGLGMKNKLAAELLLAADIDPTRRAETVSIDEWARLSMAYAEAVTP